MKLATAIESLGSTRATSIAQEIAEEIGIGWDDGISVIFSALTSDSTRIPTIGGQNDDERAVIRKWLLKYQRGKEGRASQRNSNLPGTVADPIIEEIIGARLTSLSDSDLNEITYAHRLAMSAENILGLILEEYIANNIAQFGWHCAWGETVTSVDFVHEDGRLLQIKNRSNSENSSSSTVRNGTNIEKWFRIKANRVEYMWSTLNEICNCNLFSEQSFVSFVNTTITNNPRCLAVESQNPWG